MSENSIIEFGNSKLFYQKSGKGSKHLLLFHGFGQNHQVFEPWTQQLSDTYTLYAFDIFFHGQSERTFREEPVEKSDWKEIIRLFLEENDIHHFSLLGFSMGGKFALCTLELFSGKVDELFLLAPDGIKTSFWYSLATYPVALRKLFKSMIDKPGRFHTIAQMANKLGLVDKGVLRFAQSQIDSWDKRERVYYSWIVFRHFKFIMDSIARIINTRQIRVMMIIGKYDRIITVKNMNRLLDKLTSADLKIIDTGHNGIIVASAELIGSVHKS